MDVPLQSLDLEDQLQSENADEQKHGGQDEIQSPPYLIFAVLVVDEHAVDVGRDCPQGMHELVQGSKDTHLIGRGD